MRDISFPLKKFAENANQLKLENSVIIRSVNKLWRDHYDEDYIQSEAFMEDVNQIVENDFVGLYQSSIISLYTYLETAIKDLILELIKYHTQKNTAQNIAEISNINVSLIEYMALDEEQKLIYLTTNFEKQQGGAAPYGIERFEKLLKPFKLNGEINSAVKKSINELAQTRNNLIHKAGIVDKWFMKQCPWLYEKYKIGDKLIVNHSELENWMDVTLGYCADIEQRVQRNLP